ncbi:MAG: hypothetical protein GF365_00100 [Candidatus Buchananbacteria bacterium]|nr:hypothetical protein [Candidatus Buchananbacteria bacterium]
MIIKNKNKYFIFIVFLVIFLILPVVGLAQSEDFLSEFSQDVLLKEYLFPVSSYTEAGNPITKQGLECEEYKEYASLTDWQACFNLPDFNENNISQWVDGSSLYTPVQAEISYKFNVLNQGNYVFKISTANSADNLAALTREQINYYLNNQGETMDSILDNLGEGFEAPETESEKMEYLRSLIFSVYVDGQAEENRKGYLIIKNTDQSEVQEGSVLIGNLKPGDHNIYLHFLYDFYWDFSGVVDELPDYFDAFANADLNDDQVLDSNPIIYSAAIDQTRPADDIIGVRIYSNKMNQDPLSWYQENVFNASANVTQTEVDGYRAIRDDRTVYVEAANVTEAGRFYTNIYVIAYNLDATASTINIFNQMLNNWTFNKNIIEQDPFGAEEIKDKLRRDTIRLSDLNDMRDLIENYRAVNGRYPTLEAGTFVSNHTISIWPSWQANLGNQLGAGLPVDPLNIMSTEVRGTYNCQSSDPNEYENCVNICTRDNAGNALTGCPANQQCIDNEYCSICPPGYDPETCWDEINSDFAYDTHQGCDESKKLNGSFNLHPDDPETPERENLCEHEGAFVYQYTSLNDGQSYALNYRLEYTEAPCSPGQCYFEKTDTCYQPGACLANCSMVDTDGDGIEDEMQCEYPEYTNIYCYLGNWRQSCGDGFVQTGCGEACDGTSTSLQTGELSWCDQMYNPGFNRDWYNEDNITSSCNNECQWQGFDTFGYTPLPYTPDTDDIDCGGYCGDQIKQALYGEQCDMGSTPGVRIPTPADNGSGGISRTSQYLCSGATGIQAGEPINIDAQACEYFANSYNEPIDTNNSCDILTLANVNDDWINLYEETALVAKGGFKTVYDFTIDQQQSGFYNFRIRTANQGDKISSLSNEQLAYIIAQKQADDDLHNITTEGGLSIPEYGEIAADDNQKYNLLRSLIYAVYLDGDNPENLVDFIIVPASDQIQERSISLGSLSAGNHTIYLHFIGDHFWYEFNPGDLPDYLGNFTNADLDENNALDINPILASVSLFAPELDVGNCQSYGGWCGDGTVQLAYDEKCDIGSYVTPSSVETVNVIKNSSFEEVFTPWQIREGEVSLDESVSFAGAASLKISSGSFAETAKTIWLEQSNTLFKDKAYNISFKINLISGILNNISFEIGDKSADQWYGGAQTISLEDQASAWSYYQLDSFIPTEYGYKFRLNFNVDPNTEFYIDDIKLVPSDPSVRPQYQCGNEPITGRLCQFRGGFCGDGVVQLEFGESCDDRVGLSCANGEGCGPNGYCDDDNICRSIDCNDVCRSTFCGDGIVQRPNSFGVNEVCDWGSDPLCSYNCRQVRMGGDCTNDLTNPCDPDIDENCFMCEQNLSCTVRNFGDTETKCLGARGSYGCNSNNDCILGYYCDINTSKCEPEISTYLKYHPKEETQLTLPSPSNVSYDINISKCPEFRYITAEDDRYILDICTGINWNLFDNISRPTWTYQSALEDACGGAFRLPTILELYSLVRQTNQGLLYADKQGLNLCPLGCEYDENDPDDLCNDPCGDDNYLYWSGTCVERARICDGGDFDGQACRADSDCGSGSSCVLPQQDICAKALAVNFRYGSIEEYPTINFAGTDYNEQTVLKARCLKDTVCGNGEIEEGETCEFFRTANGDLIEQEITRQCSEFGYNDGFLHCDPVSCTYLFDNCYFYSQVGQSCEDVCQGEKTLDCQSVGLNNTDNQTAGQWVIANDGNLLDVDQAGNCVAQEIPGANQTDYCNYEFVDRDKACFDTLTNEFAPANSQFSYCNCAE